MNNFLGTGLQRVPLKAAPARLRVPFLSRFCFRLKGHWMDLQLKLTLSKRRGILVHETE